MLHVRILLHPLLCNVTYVFIDLCIFLVCIDAEVHCAEAQRCSNLYFIVSAMCLSKRFKDIRTNSEISRLLSSIESILPLWVRWLNRNSSILASHSSNTHVDMESKGSQADLSRLTKSWTWLPKFMFSMSICDIWWSRSVKICKFCMSEKSTLSSPLVTGPFILAKAQRSSWVTVSVRREDGDVTSNQFWESFLKIIGVIPPILGGA